MKKPDPDHDDTNDNQYAILLREMDVAKRDIESLHDALEAMDAELRNERCLCIENRDAADDSTKRIRAALNVIKARLESGKLRPSETATLYEIRMHLESTSFIDQLTHQPQPAK